MLLFASLRMETSWKRGRDASYLSIKPEKSIIHKEKKGKMDTGWKIPIRGMGASCLVSIH
jgi:hypothetical protein